MLTNRKLPILNFLETVGIHTPSETDKARIPQNNIIMFITLYIYVILRRKYVRTGVNVCEEAVVRLSQSVWSSNINNNNIYCCISESINGRDNLKFAILLITTQECLPTQPVGLEL